MKMVIFYVALFGALLMVNGENQQKACKRCAINVIDKSNADDSTKQVVETFLRDNLESFCSELNKCMSSPPPSAEEKLIANANEVSGFDGKTLNKIEENIKELTLNRRDNTVKNGSSVLNIYRNLTAAQGETQVELNDTVGSTTFQAIFETKDQQSISVAAFSTLQIQRLSLQYEKEMRSDIRSKSFYNLPTQKYLTITAYYTENNRTLTTGKVSFITNNSSPQDFMPPICREIKKQKNKSVPERKLHKDVNFACCIVEEEKLLTEPCTTNTSSDRFTRCECNHFSTFSVALALDTVAIPYHVKIFTYAAHSITIFFLAITIPTLVIWKDELNSDRTTIQISMSTATLALHIFFLLHDAAVDTDVTCVTVTIAAHYFLLSSAFWSLNEGIRLLMATTNPVEFRIQNPSQRSKAFSVLGWTIPAIIVAMGAGLGLLLENYMTPNQLYKNCSRFEPDIPKYDRCWLAAGKAPFIGSLVVPVALILVANFIIAVWTTLSLTAFGKKRRKLKREVNITVVQLKKGIGSLTFLVMLLGIPWVVGFFTGSADELQSEIAMYVHVFFNGFQGLWLFILYIIYSDQIWAIVCAKRRRIQAKKQSITNSKTQETSL